MIYCCSPDRWVEVVGPHCRLCNCYPRHCSLISYKHACSNRMKININTTWYMFLKHICLTYTCWIWGKLNTPDGTDPCKDPYSITLSTKQCSSHEISCSWFSGKRWLFFTRKLIGTHKVVSDCKVENHFGALDGWKELLLKSLCKENAWQIWELLLYNHWL